MRSGRKPSEAAALMRSIILDLIEEQPGITGREITLHAEKLMPLDRNLVKNAMKALLANQEIAHKHINSKLCKYTIAKPGYDQRILHITADKLPRLTGPIYSPMAWFLNQLQAVT
jgi:hypothetical protein